jgi:hypothetical protein
LAQLGKGSVDAPVMQRMPLKQSQIRILEEGSTEPEGSTFPRDDFVVAVPPGAVGNAAGWRQARPAVLIRDASMALVVNSSLL